MRRKVWLILALGFGVGLSGTFGRGDDQKKGGPPDEKAMMEAIAKAATPGEPHKKLDIFAGNWDLAITYWMDPTKPGMEMKATSEAKWIMGNRFIEERVLGEFGGAPFHGHGLVGYDNLARSYTSTWIDNHGTSILYATGNYDAEKHIFTFVKEERDPLSGQKMKGRDVLKIVSKDKYESTMYKTMGDHEMKVMHIVYSRKK